MILDNNDSIMSIVDVEKAKLIIRNTDGKERDAEIAGPNIDGLENAGLENGRRTVGRLVDSSWE